MVAELNTAQLNEFVDKVNMLESQGYDLSYTIDRLESGKFKISTIVGKISIVEDG